MTIIEHYNYINMALDQVLEEILRGEMFIIFLINHL
jgi:hypothetical protein